jgi:hypothetical protein
MKLGYNPKNRESIDWFVGKIKSAASPVTKNNILGSRNRVADSTAMGKMYFFAYDPKHKKTLPYYDTFPLIFIIEEYEDGFLGLNLHYLNMRDRAVLLNRLSAFKNNSRYDETTRIKVSYDMIAAASKLDMAKPCIKRYLFNHVRSRFIEIPASEWDMAIFMPVDNFVGMSSKNVHKNSGKYF